MNQVVLDVHIHVLQGAEKALTAFCTLQTSLQAPGDELGHRYICPISGLSLPINTTVMLIQHRIG